MYQNPTFSPTSKAQLWSICCELQNLPGQELPAFSTNPRHLFSDYAARWSLLNPGVSNSFLLCKYTIISIIDTQITIWPLYKSDSFMPFLLVFNTKET